MNEKEKRVTVLVVAVCAGAGSLIVLLALWYKACARWPLLVDIAGFTFTLLCFFWLLAFAWVAGYWRGYTAPGSGERDCGAESER